MKKKAIKFEAPWCGACLAFTPTWKEVKSENTEWEFEEINVDEYSETAEKYGIMSIPTMVLEVDGRVLEKVKGGLSKKQLIDKLNSWK